MGRYLAGIASALLLVLAGMLWWKSEGAAQDPIPPAPVAMAVGSEPAVEADPPQASAKTREERRFSRYDKDKDGAIVRDEYLLARNKAFAKLDTNGDGRLGFEEYAVATAAKFAKADGDRSGRLDAAEFLTTRVVRKAAVRCACPAVAAGDED